MTLRPVLPESLPSAAQSLSAWAADPFAWEAAWSYQRLIYAALLAIGLFLFLFLVLFPARLDPRRDSRTAPWPLDAFGQCLALSVFLAVCSFLLFFAWIADELRQAPLRIFPNSWAWLNWHGRWLGVLFLGAAVSGLILYLVRHRDASKKART